MSPEFLPKYCVPGILARPHQTLRQLAPNSPKAKGRQGKNIAPMSGIGRRLAAS